MKAIMILSGGGALVILTSHKSETAPDLLEKLASKEISKFVAFDVPVDLAKQRYGGHFGHVMQDLHKTDELRILDINGARAFSLFAFGELSEPIFYELAKAA